MVDRVVVEILKDHFCGVNLDDHDTPLAGKRRQTLDNRVDLSYVNKVLGYNHICRTMVLEQTLSHRGIKERGDSGHTTARSGFGNRVNWLDTEEHGRGTIFWRFLLPEGTPEKPECQVVPLSTLENG